MSLNLCWDLIIQLCYGSDSFLGIWTRKVLRLWYIRSLQISWKSRFLFHNRVWESLSEMKIDTLWNRESESWTKKRKKNFNCPRIPPPMIKCQSIEEKGGGGGGGGWKWLEGRAGVTRKTGHRWEPWGDKPRKRERVGA